MIVMVTMMIVMVIIIIFMEPRPPLPSLCNESQALPDHYRWHLRWTHKIWEKGGDDDDDDDDYDDFVDDDHDFDKNGSDGDSPLLSPRPYLSWSWSLDMEPWSFICKGHWTGMNQVKQELSLFHR